MSTFAFAPLAGCVYADIHMRNNQRAYLYHATMTAAAFSSLTRLKTRFTRKVNPVLYTTPSPQFRLFHELMFVQKKKKREEKETPLIKIQENLVHSNILEDELVRITGQFRQFTSISLSSYYFGCC